jgi:nitroreductase
MQLNKAIQNRKSVRKYSPKKPDWRKIIEAIDAARYAPMAGNNFSLKFILVDDQEKIQKITKACQQDFMEKAQYLVVACSNNSRLVNAYGKRGERYSRQQAGAAIQNFLLKIEEAKLSTCWIGHFVDSQIKKVLDISKETDIEAIFPIGHEYEKAKTRKRKADLDNFLYFNEYGNKQMKSPRVVNENA